MIVLDSTGKWTAGATPEECATSDKWLQIVGAIGRLSQPPLTAKAFADATADWRKASLLTEITAVIDWLQSAVPALNATERTPHALTQ